MHGRAWAGIVGLVVMTGCVEAPPAARLESNARPTVVEQCAQVTGTQLGALPFEVKLGTATVAFREWTLADAESTAAVGFAATVPPGVTWRVRAGDEVFTGSGGRWLHPRGVAGPRVHGIEGIEFCRVAPGLDPDAVLAAR